MRKWNEKSTNRIETSKKLLIVALTLCGFVSIATVIAVFYTHDTSPLDALIAGCFGLTSTAYGFYYWKAKSENVRKYGKGAEE